MERWMELLSWSIFLNCKNLGSCVLIVVPFFTTSLISHFPIAYFYASVYISQYNLTDEDIS